MSASLSSAATASINAWACSLNGVGVSPVLPESDSPLSDALFGSTDCEKSESGLGSASAMLSLLLLSASPGSEAVSEPDDSGVEDIMSSSAATAAGHSVVIQSSAARNTAMTRRNVLLFLKKYLLLF